jgi:flagellar export protein FliJ
MAKFRFELEAVLKQRRAVELEKQLVVATLEAQRLQIEDQIRGCQREIVREKEELRDQLQQERSAGEGLGVAVDLRGVRFQAAAGLRLVAKAQHAVLQLAGVHKRLDAARLELLRATTHRKAVETLRERRLEAWRVEQNRKEAATLDELGVMRAARQSRDDEASQEAA